MPLIIQAFFASLAALLPSLVSKVLVSLGFGYVTYELGQFGVDYVYQQITAYASTLPIEMIAVLKLAKTDVAVGIVLGSYAAALSIKGLTSAGSVTKFSMGAPK